MVCELIQQSWTAPLLAYAATLVVIALVALATNREHGPVPLGRSSAPFGRTARSACE
jgi:hypothetical protein